MRDKEGTRERRTLRERGEKKKWEWRKERMSDTQRKDCQFSQLLKDTWEEGHTEREDR